MYFIRIGYNDYILIDRETNVYLKIPADKILMEDHDKVMIRYAKKSPTLTFKRHDSYFISPIDIDVGEVVDVFFKNEQTEHIAVIMIKQEIENKYGNRESI